MPLLPQKGIFPVITEYLLSDINCTDATLSKSYIIVKITFHIMIINKIN